MTPAQTRLLNSISRNGFAHVSVNGHSVRTLIALERLGLVEVARRESYYETNGAFGRGNVRRHYYISYAARLTDTGREVLATITHDPPPFLPYRELPGLTTTPKGPK